MEDSDSQGLHGTGIVVAPTQTHEVIVADKDHDLLARTVCKGANPDQLSLFARVCNERQLNPFTKQIYGFIKGGALSIITGIDGFRAIAQRTGERGNRIGPFWCGQDGEWKDVWLDKAPPAAAKVGYIRKGHDKPTFAVVHFEEFYAHGKDPWVRMPKHMLSKVAEAHCLRSLFPDELSGLYTQDEMDQAGAFEPATSDAMDAVVEKYAAKSTPIVATYKEAEPVGVLEGHHMSSRDPDAPPLAAIIPFGRKKGARVTDPRVTMEDLGWLLMATKENIRDPKKKRFVPENTMFARALDEEMARRIDLEEAAAMQDEGSDASDYSDEDIPFDQVTP